MRKRSPFSSETERPIPISWVQGRMSQSDTGCGFVLLCTLRAHQTEQWITPHLHKVPTHTNTHTNTHTHGKSIRKYAPQNKPLLPQVGLGLSLQRYYLIYSEPPTSQKKILGKHGCGCVPVWVPKPKRREIIWVECTFRPASGGQMTESPIAKISNQADTRSNY
jgi:hypothetical protein